MKCAPLAASTCDSSPEWELKGLNPLVIESWRNALKPDVPSSPPQSWFDTKALFNTVGDFKLGLSIGPKYFSPVYFSNMPL